MAATRSVIVLLATVLVCKVSASKTSKLESVLRDDADGKRLIQLGKTFNNSMLKLIGHAFENLEENFVHELCHKNPCTLWSNWTTCTGKGPNTFGYQTRLRKCWYSSTDPCAQDGAATIETASKVCEGKCRSDYTFTKHGYCLKFHDILLNKHQAGKICQSEGGHVMNVDTKERLIDFTNIAKTPKFIWVDGMRANVKARFIFRNGDDPFLNQVAKWRIGQPDNGVSELCMSSRFIRSTLYWFDASCSVLHPFVCETR